MCISVTFLCAFLRQFNILYTLYEILSFKIIFKNFHLINKNENADKIIELDAEDVLFGDAKSISEVVQ